MSPRIPAARILLPVALTVVVLVPGAASAATTREIADRSLPSVVTVITGGGQGSAFAYESPGRFVTNAHVVEGSDDVELVTEDGRRLPGSVVELDAARDLAFIEADSDIPPLEPSSEEPGRGDEVVAIGSPAGLSGTVTEGIVSAFQTIEGQRLIQTDVAINPGNSGGPLLDDEGRVVGVVTLRRDDLQGVGFAVPNEEVAALDPGGSPLPDGSRAIPVAALLLVALLGAGAVVVARRRRLRRSEVVPPPTPPKTVPVTIRTDLRDDAAQADPEVTLKPPTAERTSVGHHRS